MSFGSEKLSNKQDDTSLNSLNNHDEPFKTKNVGIDVFELSFNEHWNILLSQMLRDEYRFNLVENRFIYILNFMRLSLQ